jgi:hypothetical protein
LSLLQRVSAPSELSEIAIPGLRIGNYDKRGVADAAIIPLNLPAKVLFFHLHVTENYSDAT